MNSDLFSICSARELMPSNREFRLDDDDLRQLRNDNDEMQTSDKRRCKHSAAINVIDAHFYAS